MLSRLPARVVPISANDDGRFAMTAIRRSRVVWTGWNLLGIDEMDVDGTAYVNAILSGMT